jgi:hypothetical protein
VRLGVFTEAERKILVQPRLIRKLLITAFILGLPTCLPAQTNEASWGSLNRLRAGEKVEVVETTLTKHTGTFSTVSEESIEIREGTTAETIKRENVMRVSSLGHRWRNALIVGLVGAGVGAGIGAAVAGKCWCTRGQAAGAVAVVGLAGGAAIGAALPTHDTLYRAKPH